MSTINSTITQNITLSVAGTYTSPLTVTSSGAVSVSTSDAVFGPGVQLSPGGPFKTWTVSNFGTIAATGSASGSAIVFEAGGAVTNRQGGLISGGFAGIDIISYGSVNNVANYSLITGGVAGVYIKNASNSGVTNTATITGGSVGVDLNGGGSIFTVTNSGAIQSGGTHSIFGYGFGVALRGTSGTVANTGTITVTAGTSGIAVYMGSNGVVSNGQGGATSALIKGARGINLTGAGTVSNFGAISGTAGGGVNIAYATGLGESVTNGGPSASGASIIGTSYGVMLGGPATVANFGTIAATGTGAAGLSLAKSGSVGNSGLISASEVGVQFVFGAGLPPGTMTNFGTVMATATVGAIGDGIVMNTGGTVTNGSSNGFGALISGGLNGLRSATGVSNYGVIIGTTGYGAGLSTGSLFNAQTGAIQGASDGVHFTGNRGTVVTLATISGGSGSGVYLTGFGSVTNGQSNTSTAQIRGGAAGVRIAGQGTAGTVTNFGTITATSTTGTGVTIGSGGIITNGSNGATTALIQGAAFGIKVDSSNNSTLVNFGTVAGTGSSGVGVKFTNAGTIVNAGTIIGQSGTAAQFSAANARLVVEPGAVFVGIVVGAPGGNTLELGSAASSGTVSGLGTSITNFGSIQFDAGAHWLLGGNAAGLSAGPINGFTIGDTIDLSGFVGINGTTFANNSLILSNTVGSHVTLGIQGNFSSGNFGLTADGAGGTSITFVATPVFTVSSPLMTNNNVNLLDSDQVVNGQMSYNTIGAIGPEWELDGAGVGLLNGDGQAAFLMRNTGNFANGLLDVGEVVNGSAVFTGIGGVGPEWQFAGVGNFLGHGRADFLMRNTGKFANGQLDIGEVVNGSAVFSGIGGVGPEWQFVGAGDFLGDGRTGFLMRNTGQFANGQIDVGEVVNGSAVFTGLGGIGPEWEFKGVGDYLGVGHPGFLIRNTGNVTPGRLLVGEVVNGTFTFTDIAAVGPEWEFVGSGHYLSSTSDDFLMRNTGNAANGLLDVGAISGGTAHFTAVGAVGPEWNFHSTNVAVLP